ncbi:MAG: nucleoside monophosphate kinase [Candidatus Taylorbacteria bacterium]|nr:nucleoside monophosphate kinase [Candidatus Taylorbacteria bacterium]
MKPQAFIFIGRAGSGKGTQAKLLIEALKAKDPVHQIVYIETGAEFRKFIQGDSHMAKMGKNVVEKGWLMPEFMPIYLWGKVLVEQYKGNEHIVFDGTPRKPLEAQILESVFPFYELGTPWVIYLDIEHEESHKRLTLRSQEGRKDDNNAAIERRKVAFEKDVVPTIGYYRNNPNVKFLDINGERSIEEIHADIVERLGL